MNFYRFERMGEHEKKPSRKRFRRGSVVKYRHQNFTRESNQEQLESIKRRTCPTNAKKLLCKQMKEARQLEMDNLLHHRRLINILQALNNEIRDRETAQKAREERPATATSTINTTNFSTEQPATVHIQRSKSMNYSQGNTVGSTNETEEMYMEMNGDALLYDLEGSLDLEDTADSGFLNIEPVTFQMDTNPSNIMNLITQTTGKIEAAVKNVNLHSSSIDHLMDDPYTFDFLTSL